MSLTIKLPEFKCSENILGDFGNMSDFGRAIGSVSGQLGNIAYCVTDQLRAQIENAIKTFSDTLDSIFAAINTTIPSPLWSNLKAPELEFELRMGALFQEFKLYLQQKLFDIISKIPGLDFIINLVNIPIPFLTGVKVLDVFTAEGRARIRAAVSARLDPIAKAMGMPWDLTFNGELGLKLPELQLELIVRRIFSEIERLVTSALWSALTFLTRLTKPIEKIWDALKFPRLPSFTFPSFDDFFNNIWNSIKDLAISTTEKIDKAINAMLDFDLGAYLKSAFGAILDRIPWPFPTKLRLLMGYLDRDWNISMPEWDFGRVSAAIQTLFNRIPQLIMELWLQLIKPFLNAIKKFFAIIDELLKYIPFTFCSFINLVARPILGIGNQLSSVLPAPIQVTPA